MKASLSDEEKEAHPARYALVEVENLMSPALKFEPIHRVVFGADEEFIKELSSKISGGRKIRAFTKDKEYTLFAPDDSIDAIKEIQDFIDERVKADACIEVDYIHGENYLESVVKERGGVGIVMPAPEKTNLFDFIIRRGIMPRKSFSMGEAEEKRYYFEAKKIVK